MRVFAVVVNFPPQFDTQLNQSVLSSTYSMALFVCFPPTSTENASNSKVGEYE